MLSYSSDDLRTMAIEIIKVILYNSEIDFHEVLKLLFDLPKYKK